MQIAEKRKQAGDMTQDALAHIIAESTSVKADKYLISKFENLVCLPTSDVLAVMCQVFRCGKLDLYELDEIDLISDIGDTKPVKAATSGKYHKRPHIYNLTVKLDRGVLQVLNKRVLEMFGYKDITDYITKCVDRLMKRYNKKVAQDAGTSKSDQGNS